MPRRFTCAVLLAGLLLPGCAHSHPATTHTRIEGVRAVDPSVAALSPDQKLDRSLSLPGMRGVLLGTVGAALPTRALTGGAVVTISDFTVEATYGFAGAASNYTAGQHISLAVPGGRAGNHITSAEDAPVIHPGDHLFLFDQTGAGGTAYAQLGSAVIVLADRSAVARLNPDHSITWEGFTEPAATFTQHFTNHPAHD